MQENENLKVKTKVYAQMGTLFSYQNLYVEAIDMFKHSLQSNLILKDTVGMIYNFRDMASTYQNPQRHGKLPHLAETYPATGLQLLQLVSLVLGEARL